MVAALTDYSAQIFVAFTISINSMTSMILDMCKDVIFLDLLYKST